MISPAEISPETTYHVAFDPYCTEDARHSEILRRMTLRQVSFDVPPKYVAIR